MKGTLFMDETAKPKRNLEYKLIGLLVFFGLLYVFITPPFQMADEDSHFKRAFLVSQLNILPDANSQGELGFYIPEVITEFEGAHRYLIGNTSEKFSFEKYYLLITTSVDYTTKEFQQFSTVKTNPLLYLPQALSMWVLNMGTYVLSLGKAELITPIHFMYAGRIGNLLFFIFCAYFSLKLIPFYKRVIFLLCCMPMTLGLITSISYDSMVIGVSLLLISYSLKLIYEKNMSYIMDTKKIILFIILSFILIQLKQVYFFLIFLLLLIPNSRFKSFKHKLMIFGAMFFSGVISYAMWSLLSSKNGYFRENGSDVSGQLNFIVKNPFEFLKVLGNTFNELSYYYTNSFIGNLGWLDTNFPPTFIYLFCIVLLMTAMVDGKKDLIIKWKTKLFLFSVFLISVVFIEIALYLTWTSIPSIGGVGYSIVSGVQGRYFIPIAILALLIFYNTRISVYVQQNYAELLNTILMAFCKFSCSFMLFLLLIRYWI